MHQNIPRMDIAPRWLFATKARRDARWQMESHTLIFTHRTALGPVPTLARSQWQLLCSIEVHSGKANKKVASSLGKIMLLNSQNNNYHFERSVSPFPQTISCSPFPLCTLTESHAWLVPRPLKMQHSQMLLHKPSGMAWLQSGVFLFMCVSPDRYLLRNAFAKFIARTPVDAAFEVIFACVFLMWSRQFCFDATPQ